MPVASPVNQPIEDRPFVGPSSLVVIAGILLALGVALTLVFIESKRREEQFGTRPPVLTLRFKDQTLDGWLGGYSWDRGPIVDVFETYVRGPAVRVPPGAYLTVTTSSDLGAPIEATAHFHKASLPYPCADPPDMLPAGPILCIDSDPSYWYRKVPVTIDAVGTLSFEAPSEPGAYQMAILAWWPDELGGGMQEFAIEVRP
jgi:hypothetical protein